MSAARRTRLLAIVLSLLGLGCLGWLAAGVWFWPGGETAAAPPPGAIAQAPSPETADPAPPAPPSEPKQSPHPFSTERSQLQEAGFLLHHIGSALDEGDLARAIALLGEHARKYPESDPVEREGYEFIVLCFQTKDEQAVAQARKFLADHRESRLRKRLRKACLDPPP